MSKKKTKLLGPFEKALKRAKAKPGICIYRTEWEGRFVVVLYEHSGSDILSRDFLLKVASEGHTEPWFPTQQDMFANDWFSTREKLECHLLKT